MSTEIPNRVLVTITDRESKYKTDIELPSHMAVNDLSKGIIRLLREFEPRIYAGRDSVELWVEDTKLRNEQTLASAGVWDGSEISLRFPKKGLYY